MKPQEIIRKKRDGLKLSKDEIAAFISGVTDESWADYQISALTMAMFLNGLDSAEAAILTDEMLGSGVRLDFSDLDQPIADKHSTGGVGDKTSLIIAPLAAACGVCVPMISGRGLGHTGGTLDKLESIRGYNVNLSLTEFKQIVKKCGFAMTGQTAEIAPADRKLYALRDATATVESIPLIVASIMSKKIAEGLDALVLDVKTGAGAFMPTFEKSQELARALIETGNNCGVKTEAVISDMNQPLGKFVGNALEVYECVKILRGETEDSFADTLELSLDLTARMLMLTGICKNYETAHVKCEEKLGDGSALERFNQNIELQNGDPSVCDKPELLLNQHLLQIQIDSTSAGFVSEIDAKAVGEAICAVGGGRTQITDKIDFAVGFECLAKIGDEINRGDTLGILHCRNQTQADLASEVLLRAFRFSTEKVDKIRLIKEIVV